VKDKVKRLITRLQKQNNASRRSLRDNEEALEMAPGEERIEHEIHRLTGAIEARTSVIHSLKRLLTAS
jgi:hypothetical protein